MRNARKNARKLVTVMSGGALPQSAPTAAMGWRAYWNAMDAATLFTDAGTTPVSASGQFVYQMSEKLGVVATSYFRQTTEANRPEYLTGGAGGKSYLSFDGTAYKMVSLAASNFLAVGAKTIIIAFSIEGAVAANVDNIFGDTQSVYQMVTPNASTIRYTSYDTGYRYSTGQAYTASTPLIYVAKHDTGKLYDAKNGVVWSTGVDASNTGSLANLLAIAGQASTYTPMKFYAACVANTVVADPNISLVVNYLQAQLGL